MYGMEPTPRPTIKGIFVKSHIRGLERERGGEAVRELERRIGHPVNYKNSDDVPIAEEVRILESIVDIEAGTSLKKEERELEAGRLHFRNFSTTPLWTILNSILGSNPKFLLMQSSRIAGYVFQDVEFASEDMGEESVKITLFNNEYPIRHFQGFFQEWLHAFGLDGKVLATSLSHDRYECLLSWKEPDHS